MECVAIHRDALEVNLMEIRLLDLRGGYRDLVTTIREAGIHVKVRDQETREMTGITLRFADTYLPLLPVDTGRKINTRLAAVEALQLIGGYDAQSLMLRAAPDYGHVMVDPSDLAYGAYGPRVSPQLPQIVQQLRSDPTTRQAVMTIWRTDDLTHQGDKPCTLVLQFLIREKKLQLHTMMRSQDVWLGVPYDVFMFTQLQLTVAQLLGIGSGPYVHHVTSLHMYERDVEASRQLDYPTGLAELPIGVQMGLNTDVGSMLTYVRMLLKNDPGLYYDPDWVFKNNWYVNRIEKLHRAQKEVAT